MGGAVSSGCDNHELTDNLVEGNYIRTKIVERVFRVIDRANYMTPQSRDQAYKDLAWRYGPLHLSAPCIYSEVMEALELKKGLSFLNIGSGTGYLSTMAGLVLGDGGINHGVEIHPVAHEYSTRCLGRFFELSWGLDEFDFCEPTFFYGNGLCLEPLQSLYDRVYVGAGCKDEHQDYFKQLIRVGGILVLPLNDSLLQVRRVSENEWSSRCLLNVSFSTLLPPADATQRESLKLECLTPPRLAVLSRGAVRAALRGGVLRRAPELRPDPAHDSAPASPAAPPPRARPERRSNARRRRLGPRNLRIPILDADEEDLNALHELDAESGGNEMNALLSLVLNMGYNRVSGALRFDALDSTDEDQDDEEREDDGDADDTDGEGEREAEGEAEGEPRGLNYDALAADCRNLRDIYYQLLADNEPSDEGSPALGEASGASGAPAGGGARGSPEASPAAARKDVSSDAPSTSATSNESAEEKVESTVLCNKCDAKNKILASSTTTSESCVENAKGLDDDEVVEGAKGMEWTDVPKAGHISSDEETIEKEFDCKAKRQKLDSGIGEEASRSSGSSPLDHQADLDRDENIAVRRRRHKRSRRSATPSSGSGSPPPRAASRSPCRARDRDARLVRLSLAMKRAVDDLPLPHALKLYVNYGRGFQP